MLQQCGEVWEKLSANFQEHEKKKIVVLFSKLTVRPKAKQGSFSSRFL